MICFQIVSLTYWKTTRRWFGAWQLLLWFAFKLYLWRIEKQRFSLYRKGAARCDLLSNCIFDVLKNNIQSKLLPWEKVVICFQIVSLTYWKTTDFTSVIVSCLLWFAFKLYLWRIEKQHYEYSRNYIQGCDLLSNCIFDVLKNNISMRSLLNGWVVICFQIVSLTYWKTTSFNVLNSRPPLWFAFKLYLWRIEKQQWICFCIAICSCDLLSNCIFDVLKNNRPHWRNEGKDVVICFQIVSLTYWKTTKHNTNFTECKLWFAFKLYLWRIEKQP